MHFSTYIVYLLPLFGFLSDIFDLELLFKKKYQEAYILFLLIPQTLSALFNVEYSEN